jgi:beta-lactamase regulating signal transducer with metallopeptidase domain/protocatechuate 3,4-dioxygenase beta subunit
MTGIFAALLNGMIVSVVLCGLIWLVLRVIPRRAMNAATRYAVWWCVLAVTMTLPLLYLPEPVRHGGTETPTAIPGEISEALTLDAPEDAPVLAMEPLPARTPAAAPPEPFFALPSFPVRVPASAWPVRILGVWAAVSVALFARLLASSWLLSRRRSRSADLPVELAGRVRIWFRLTGLTRRSVRVAASADVDVPVAIGPYRPAILLPWRLLDELDEADLDRVGLHETAHLARRDDYAILVQRVAEALMALHPVVRWITRRIDLEREIACDDFVIAATGNPRGYASCLARIAERNAGVRFTMAAGVADQRSHLSRRIETLLDGARHTGPRLLKTRLALAAAVLCCAMWAAGTGPALLAFAPVPQAPAPRSTHAPPPSLSPTPATQAVAPPGVPVQLPQEQLSGVSGTVVSRAGSPIQSAIVFLRPTGAVEMPRGANRFFRGSTDADGKFTFEGVIPGDYLVFVSHPAYLAVLPDRGSPTVAVAAGRSREVKIEMMDQSTVSGTVVDEDGDPFAGTTVEVLRVTYHQGRLVLTTLSRDKTDDQGKYTVRNLGAGKYYLRATRELAVSADRRGPVANVKPGAQDLRYGSTYYPNAVDPSGATAFFVGDAQNIDGIDVRMKKFPWFHVRGKVLGDLGGLPEVRVMRMPREPGYPPGWSLAASIGLDGSFDLANMWPGQFTIAARTMRGEILGWTPITISDRDLENVVVNAAAADVSGVVRVDSGTEANAPIPALQITLLPGEGPSVFPYAARIEQGGTFTIPRVAPGRYRVALAGVPDGSYLKAIQLGGQNGLNQVLDLRPGSGGAPLEIVISPKAGSIVGAVTDRSGKLLPGGTVTLVPATPSPGHDHLYPIARVDETGRFRIPSVVPGTYRLYAWEQFENTAHWNLEFMRLFESRGERVTISEGGTEQRTLTRISTAEVSELVAKAGPQDWTFYLIR